MVFLMQHTQAHLGVLGKDRLSEIVKHVNLRQSCPLSSFVVLPSEVGCTVSELLPSHVAAPPSLGSRSDVNDDGVRVVQLNFR